MTATATKYLQVSNVNLVVGAFEASADANGNVVNIPVADANADFVYVPYLGNLDVYAIAESANAFVVDFTGPIDPGTGNTTVSLIDTGEPVFSPFIYSEWNPVANTWLNTPTLVQAKELKIAEMDAAKEIADNDPVPYTFASVGSSRNMLADRDERSYISQTALEAATTSNANITFDLVTVNNSTVSATVDEVIDFNNSVQGLLMANKINYEVWFAIINAQSTVPGVEAIDVSIIFV